MLIDTHTHVNFNEFEADTREVIERAFAHDVWMVNVGTKLETSKSAIALAEKYDEGVYATVGVHPIHLVDAITETSDYDVLRALATSSPKVVGIGEVGLDYYHTEGKSTAEIRALQMPAFRQAVRLAKELNLALVVHARGEKEAPYAVYDEILSILCEEGAVRGVAHCFGGTLEQAQAFIALGFNIGVTGIVTFKNAGQLQEIVKTIPLEHILIETDAPYLAPQAHRGERNEPSYVRFVAEEIAKLRDISFEKVALETTINARRMYII